MSNKVTEIRSGRYMADLFHNTESDWSEEYFLTNIFNCETTSNMSQTTYETSHAQGIHFTDTGDVRNIDIAYFMNDEWDDIPGLIREATKFIKTRSSELLKAEEAKADV